MFRTLSLLSLFIVCSNSLAQFGWSRIDTITVIDGTVQDMPWAGGLDYPQFSNIDLNWDGENDLFAFDRTCDKVLTFLHTGGVGSTEYIYAPEYESIFPSMMEWTFLRDYNCDGKPDIFTYAIGGVTVYTNVGNAGSGHQFQLTKPYLYTTLFGNPNTFISVSGIDIPAFVDIDGDTDLDIITFYTGDLALEYHKNLSMETYGHCDSLKFETKNQCWGRFRESSVDNQLILYDTLNFPCDGTISNPESPVLGEEQDREIKRHAGSTILPLDMDNDGVMDLVLGDISFANMAMLMNGGAAPNQNSSMVSVIYNFPANSTPVNLKLDPAGYHVDVDNDGIRDLLVAPAMPVGSENKDNIWYYDNTSIDPAPVFNYVQNNFLQTEMIETGSGALPVFFDHNGDGLKDLLVSQHAWFNPGTSQNVSKIYYYENTGTQSNPEFTFVTDDYQGISTMGLGNNLVFYPTFGDLDNDGDEDMILGEYTGYLYFLQNTGGAGNPAIFNTAVILQEYFSQQDSLAPLFESIYAYPQLVDLDRDNDLDLVLGKRSGKLSWYKNVGNIFAYKFEKQTTNLGGVDVSEYWTVEGHSVPQFIDIDNTYHLIVGSKSGALHYFDNIEGNLTGTFNLVDSTLEDINIGTYSAPAIFDLTNDGHFEMVLGNQRGGVALYKSAHLTQIGIEENEVSEIRVYPNPSNGNFIVDLGTMTFESLKDARINLFDISGRNVMQIQPTSSIVQIDADHLSKGTYLLQLYTRSGTVTKKLLFQ
ncbi:MAG: T9SS type A sorting domain-containing protein [Crocinitomicaceae bacterium]|nr:T9SS type A sorting domain-containing protein [Crocinitomicaceae bacterium]